MQKKAIIAGAGPAGALTAILLAKQGYSVDVYEKRACPEVIPPKNDSKAYLLNLNARAFAAFKAADISMEAPIKRCNGRSEFIFRDRKGRVIGGVSDEVTVEKPAMIRVYRDELSRHLIDEAQRLHPQAIKFYFEAPITAVNFPKRTATVSGPQSKEVQYDLLIGADGANSAIRSELQKVMPPDFVQRRLNDAVYATGPLNVEGKDEYPEHTFTTMDQFEAGAIMLYGRSSRDRRIGFFLDAAGAQRIRSGDDAWLQEYLDTTMPQLPSDARKSAKQMAAHPPDFAAVSGWTVLSQMHGPRVALVGDAAHTMTPVLGQGCNSGLEDAHILTDILSEISDTDQALSTYTERRLPDITALVRLNEIAAYGRFHAGVTCNEDWKHRVWLLTHSAIMGLQMAKMGLHRKAPGLFPMPVTFKAVTGKVPFREVMPAAYLDAATFTLLTGTLFGALYLGLRAAVRSKA